MHVDFCIGLYVRDNDSHACKHSFHAAQRAVAFLQTLRAQFRVRLFDLLLHALDGLEVLGRLDVELCVAPCITSGDECHSGRTGTARVYVPAVASSSTTISAQGCIWGTESVQRWFTLSSVKSDMLSPTRPHCNST